MMIGEIDEILMDIIIFIYNPFLAASFGIGI